MSDQEETRPTEESEELPLEIIPRALQRWSGELLDRVLAIPYGRDVRRRVAFGGEEEVAAVKAVLLAEIEKLRQAPGGASEAAFLAARLEERAAPYTIPDDASAAERRDYERLRKAGEADRRRALREPPG
ncbi:MAG: hypothetical protein HUU35_19190 [Armatimonadetes bacterium]|nr:hypothetical protein [Armatimonadota bacterium]